MLLIWGGNSLDTRTIDPAIPFVQFEGRRDRDLINATETIKKGKITKIVIYTRFCSHAQSKPIRELAKREKIECEFASSLAAYRRKK